jgi:hypothetical protein
VPLRDKKLRNILAVIRFKFYFISIVAEAINKLVSTITETKRISFMPNYAKAASYDYNSLVALLKPIVKLMLPIIVTEMGDDFYLKYNDSTTIESIAGKVETSLNALKAIYPDVQTRLTELAGIVCNG